MKFYAGIGSRKAPQNILDFLTKIAGLLGQRGYVLRSGGARGCDTFFERGVGHFDIPPNSGGLDKRKEIFTSRDAEAWAFDLVPKYLPTDRSPYLFNSWSPYVKGLLARNMMIILGRDGNSPVDFVVCWTPPGDYQTSAVGGTGYALRLAQDRGIPIYNLGYPEQLVF